MQLKHILSFYVSFIILSTVVIAGACTNYFQSTHLCEQDHLILDLFHFDQCQHVSFDLLPRLLSGHCTGHCMWYPWNFLVSFFKINLCLTCMRSAVWKM